MTSIDPGTPDRRGRGDTRRSVRSWSFRWGPTVAFAALLVLASVVPIPGGTAAGAGGALPFGVGLTDPFHVVGYAVLAALATRGTGRTRRGLIVAAALSTGIGFGVEVLQSTIPWRTFAWRDVAVNAGGAALGVLAVAARTAGDAVGGERAGNRP